MAGPVHKIQYGRFSLAIFENECQGKDGSFTSVSGQLSAPKKLKDSDKVEWINMGINNPTDAISAIKCLEAFLEYKLNKNPDF